MLWGSGWTAAAMYPFVLHVAMASGHDGIRTVEIAPVLVMTVLLPLVARRAPLPVLVLLTVGWAVAWLEMPTLTIGVLFALSADFLVGYLAWRWRRPTSLIGFAVLLSLQLAEWAIAGSPTRMSPWQPGMMVLLPLAAIVAWMFGGSLRQSRLHAEELAARSAAEAVTAERLRIARELHDMVAHSIGVIAIQAGVGARVIDTQPAEARNALHAIEDTSRETLAGLRRMLGALRRVEDQGDAPRTPAPGLDGLDRLVRTTGDAGVRIDVHRRGAPRPLPAEVDLSAFRIVQEAVTNVVRHAHTGRCDVSLDYTPEELIVEVTDTGRGPSAKPDGYGLVGMRERVALLGGTIATGPRPGGGFRVEARLPLPEAAR